MPGFSGIDLWESARKDAESTRFLKLALLAETVDHRLERGAKVDFRPAVPFLAKLSFAQLFDHPRAFFWRDLDGYLRQAAATDGPIAAERNLALRMLDAFFEVLPEGFELPLTGTPGERIVFPELGLQIAGSGRQVLRKQADGLTVTRPGEDPISIDTARPDSRFRLRTIALSDQGRGKLLASSSTALFDSSYGDGIIFELPQDRSLQLAQAIREAYEFLRRIDPCVPQRLFDNISWYIPVRSPHPNVHVSFSVPRLSGVIFLSEPTPELGSPHWLKLAEVLVHEFAHNELSLYQESHKLFHEDPADGFCSPWRPDPRPLNGIIHGMYAFWHVAEFFRCAEAAVSPERASQLRSGHRRLLSQLWFAQMQVPRERLLDRGSEIVEWIARQVEDQIANLGETASRLEPEVAAHIAQWKADHPDHSGQIRFR